MTTGLLLVLLVFVAAAAYLAAPLLRRDALEPEELRRPAVDALRELNARQQMLLASLKDLEDDRQTDKIGDEDYAALKERLSLQAIEIMQKIDLLEAERLKEIEAAEAAARPLQYPGPDRGDGVT